MKYPSSRYAILLAALLLMPALPACTPVKAYQRGTLAGPTMQFQLDGYAEGQIRSMREILEAGTLSGGGPGGGGGGCGCK
jgi:hypothetical protein